MVAPVRAVSNSVVWVDHIELVVAKHVLVVMVEQLCGCLVWYSQGKNRMVRGCLVFACSYSLSPVQSQHRESSVLNPLFTLLLHMCSQLDRAPLLLQSPSCLGCWPVLAKVEGDSCMFQGFCDLSCM
jgi:hypothetical protein